MKNGCAAYVFGNSPFFVIFGENTDSVVLITLTSIPSLSLRWKDTYFFGTDCSEAVCEIFNSVLHRPVALHHFQYQTQNTIKLAKKVMMSGEWKDRWWCTFHLYSPRWPSAPFWREPYKGKSEYSLTNFLQAKKTHIKNHSKTIVSPQYQRHSHHTTPT